MGDTRGTTAGSPSAARTGPTNWATRPDRVECAARRAPDNLKCGWPRRLSQPFSRELSCSPGPLAHRVEQGTFNPKVARSRLARPT